MARRIATKEDVFTAANELVKAGKLPRITAIHQIIGGGSYTTISNFLKEWESANLQEAPTEEMVLPDFMASEADFLVRKLWRTALDGAEMRVQSEREQLRSREAVINEDMQQAIDMANSNSEKIDQLEDQLAKCKEEAEKLEQDLQAKERALQMVEHDKTNMTKQPKTVPLRSRRSMPYAGRLSSWKRLSRPRKSGLLSFVMNRWC